MQIEKQMTGTYVISGVKDLDTVTVYAKNYGTGQGKIVIECCGDAWAHYWGAMGDRLLQTFFCDASNDYLLGKFLGAKTHETDFDKIQSVAEARGFDICATNEVELAYEASEMEECFGNDWMMDLPRRHTPDYHYLSKIIDAVKQAFKEEMVGK